jgi:hypothetical protein
VATHFGDSAVELTTSRTLSMKEGNSSTYRSDFDNNNIIKPTFNTLIEDGRKALKAYRIDLNELFYLHYEMTRQGAILKDVVSIIIRKTEVTSEVRPNPSLSLDDVQGAAMY